MYNKIDIYARIVFWTGLASFLKTIKKVKRGQSITKVMH